MDVIASARSFLRQRPARSIAGALVIAYALTVLANAWTCDDAFITYRVVDNLIHGYGPVFNVGERVQAYTNPLMMLLMSAFAFVTRDVYFTGLVLSAAASMTAVAILVFKVSRSNILAITAVLTLTFSEFFVAYSTSGLESCLIFLLAAIFFWLYSSDRGFDGPVLLGLTALFSLSLVNRMDTGLLLAPALGYAFIVGGPVRPLKRVGLGVLGMLPFAAWETFALVYYGFFMPNTAYAKLNTGIPQSEYILRGAWYYLLSLLQDPVLFTGIVAGSMFVLVARRLKNSVPLVGVVLYLVYILRVGGDFMRGRLLTAPFFVVMLLVVMVDPEREALKISPKAMLAGCVALLLLGNAVGMAYGSTWMREVEPYKIRDEKLLHFSATNLPLNLLRNQRAFEGVSGVEIRKRGVSPVICGGIGAPGYYGGPRIHVIDPLALSDPLLARMPALYNPKWGVGHIARYIPDGYVDTIRSGRNRLRDPKLAAYYDQLKLVISGDIWSRRRWEAIAGLNSGKFDYLIDRHHYRYEVRRQFDLDKDPIQYTTPQDESAKRGATY